MVREEPAPCRMMVQDALGNDALAVERLYINNAQRSTVIIQPRARLPVPSHGRVACDPYARGALDAGCWMRAWERPRPVDLNVLVTNTTPCVKSSSKAVLIGTCHCAELCDQTTKATVEQRTSADSTPPYFPRSKPKTVLPRPCSLLLL